MMHHKPASAIVWTGTFLVLVFLSLNFSLAQVPSPHGIGGTIYNRVGGPQVPLGTAFTVNDSSSGHFIQDVTSVPVPGYTGRYSVSIDGNDGDQVIARAWNATHWGTTNRTLQGDMLGVNIYLNRTRPPEANVTILYPEESYSVNASIVFNVTANITWIAGTGSACYANLFITNSSLANVSDGRPFNQTIGAIAAGETSIVSWNVTGLLVGIVNITVSAACSETSVHLEGNGRDTAHNITIIDNIPPSIFPWSPLNNTVSSNRTMHFRYFVNDTGVGTANCTLLIDGSPYETNTSINELWNQSLFHTFTIGTYLWQLSCQDLEGNTQTTGSYLLNISLPDLNVDPNKIIVDGDASQEMRNVTINATIENNGTLTATDAIVRFLEETPQGTFNQLGDNFTITLTPGQTTVLSVNYTTKAGTYHIHIQADLPLETNGSIEENNESNNQGNITIDIPIWQIYYGDVTQDIYLGLQDNTSLSAWFNASYTKGNIYVADSDAHVSWSTLQALSRTSTDNLQMDDFIQLDAALNYSATADSVNRTYTKHGSIINTSTFMVFDTLIDQVPVVNSTNTTSFLTGILWDTDDGTPDYDGTQDVVFVTTLTPILTQGAYGIYNYEIRIPANLERYVSPSTNNEVSFYVELE